MDATGIPEFKDFEEREEPIPFRVGTVMYEAKPSIGLGAMAQMTKMQSTLGQLQMDLASGKVDIEQVIAALEPIFTLTLMPESAVAFNKRLSDPLRPVGFKNVLSIIMWLMECYGLRPTQPSSPSSAPSATDISTSSTPGPSETAVQVGAESLLGGPST